MSAYGAGDRVIVGCDRGYHDYSYTTSGDREIAGSGRMGPRDISYITPGDRLAVGDGAVYKDGMITYPGAMNMNGVCRSSQPSNLSEPECGTPGKVKLLRYGDHKNDPFTRVFDFITGYKCPEILMAQSFNAESAMQKMSGSPAIINSVMRGNNSFNSSVLQQSYGVSDVMAKRDKSNDRGVVDLASDAYNAKQSATSGDWPSAAYYSGEVAKDVIDISKNTAEAFVESREEAVRGGYSQYSDTGL